MAKPDRTLRGHLAELGAIPRKTWASLIRLLRARKKRTGEAPVFVTGHGELQRALDWESRGDQRELARNVGRLFEMLTGLHVAKPDDIESQERASKVDALLGALTPNVRTEPVQVVVTGWPDSMPQPLREAVLGRSEESLTAMDPVDAAVLHHELAGMNFGGQRLRVKPMLFKQEVMPAAPRSRRGGPPKRERDGSWLTHVDDVGRWSATPWDIAQAHADLLKETGATEVLDLFCGCGGDAIGFAAAGMDVWGCELDGGRAALAFRNVAEFDIPGRVDVIQGDGLALLDGLREEHPGAALFVDPPWGGAEAQQEVARGARTWEELFGVVAGDDAAAAASAVLAHEGPILLKLPRDFDLATLPEPLRWSIHWQMGAQSQGAERVVKTIAALRA